MQLISAHLSNRRNAIGEYRKKQFVYYGTGLTIDTSDVYYDTDTGNIIDSFARGGSGNVISFCDYEAPSTILRTATTATITSHSRVDRLETVLADVRREIRALTARLDLFERRLNDAIG